MRRNSVFMLLLGIAGLLMQACNDTPTAADPLPYVYVNESIYMNEIRALGLKSTDGSYLFINGGLKGIIVYRKAQGVFYAIDRQSTTGRGCAVKVDPTRQFVQDTCSNTQFDFSGQLISGAPIANLRRYNVNYDGLRIQITN